MTLGGVTTSFLLDRQNVVQETQNGSPVATYLVGPRGMEYRQDASGQRRWYIYDGLGSVIAEVDQDGKVNPDQQGNETPLRKYDVYGAIRNSQEVAPGTSNHKFVGSLGHTTEAPTGGLIYMRARYYDPAIGRFISEDPGRNGVNWYAYCDDNPVNRTDPAGRYWQGNYQYYLGLMTVTLFYEWGAFFWQPGLGIGVGYGQRMMTLGLMGIDEPVPGGINYSAVLDALNTVQSVLGLVSPLTSWFNNVSTAIEFFYAIVDAYVEWGLQERGSAYGDKQAMSGDYGQYFRQ